MIYLCVCTHVCTCMYAAQQSTNITALSGRAATWLRMLPVNALRQFRSEGMWCVYNVYWCILCMMHGCSFWQHTFAPYTTTTNILPDVTVAVWMTAFNATHLDDPRLCTRDCTAGVVVYNGTILGTCNGLCDVLVDALKLHVCVLLSQGCVQGVYTLRLYVCSVTCCTSYLQQTHCVTKQHRLMRHAVKHLHQVRVCQCCHHGCRLWMPLMHPPWQQQRGRDYDDFGVVFFSPGLFIIYFVDLTTMQTNLL